MRDAKALLLSVLAIFAPAQSMILSALALITLDLITGILAARKQGMPITSAGLRRTITKLCVYESAILIGFLAQQYLTGPSVPVANIIAGFVGITECLSCLENINIIGDGDLLKKLLEKLNSKNQP